MPTNPLSKPSNRTIVSVVVAAILDTLRVHTRRRALRGPGHGVAVAAIIVNVFKVEGMDVAGEIPVSC